MKKVIVINKAFGPYRVGQEVKVECDANGVPTELVWRRRLRDAKTDNCIKMNKIKIENKSFNRGDKS